ncbi:MAG: hypothetical protein D6744_08000 [Planctomycetota bacterium]|nr:MAG: hypothetical protein D6744_08000 [Planctomycetota bacterium]
MRTPWLFGFVGAIGLMTLTGCPQQATRTSNQGGGNIITAGAKVAGGNISSLTPDEVQVLADKVASNTTDLDIPELTDEQAAAAVDFLVANDVNTIEDVQNLIEQAEQDPTSIEIPDSIQELIDAGLFSL